MKKISKTTIFILLFIFLFSITVFAHSGGTDSDGGHYNHSTGEYHYHHGYSAHQHDDGICPYASDENDEKDIPFLLDFLFIIIGFAIVGVGILTFFGFTDAPEDEKRFYIIAGFCTIIFGFSLTGLLRKAVIGTSVIYNLIICIVTLLIATPLYLIIRKNNEPQYQTTPSHEEQSNPDKPEDQTQEKEFETPCNIQNDDLIFSWAENHLFTCIDIINESDSNKDTYDLYSNCYATLDFCLFAFFYTQMMLLRLITVDAVRKIEDCYYNCMMDHFSNEISQIEIFVIFNSRFAAYSEAHDKIFDKYPEDKIIDDEIDDEINNELLQTSIQFLLKDFAGDPFGESILTAEPDEKRQLTSYILNLISQLYEQTSSYTEKLQSEYGI